MRAGLKKALIGLTIVTMVMLAVSSVQRWRRYEATRGLARMANTTEPFDPKRVRNLVHAGASVNVQGRQGQTILMAACSYGDLETVKYLITRGTPIDAQDYLGNTALMFAALPPRPKILTALLEAGADTHIRNREGMTALEFARISGDVRCVKLLRNQE